MEKLGIHPSWEAVGAASTDLRVAGPA